MSWFFRKIQAWFNPVDWSTLSDEERQRIMAQNQKTRVRTRSNWLTRKLPFLPRWQTDRVNNAVQSAEAASVVGEVLTSQIREERQAIMEDNFRRAEREGRGN
jgi:hypothetical protein